MAIKKSKNSRTRKPFWQRTLEWFLIAGKRFLIPVLVVWLVAWMWAGGVISSAKDAVWDKFVMWTASQGVVVNDVVIEGRIRADALILAKKINVKQGDPVLSVDVDTIRKRVKGMDWVRQATISRHYNGVVKVVLQERVPFVLWNRPGRKVAVVDMDGVVIETANPKDFKNLLLVSGVDATKYTVDLMRMILAEPDVANYIRAAEWVGGRRWDILSIHGTRIMLPEDDIGFALSRLAKTHHEKKILDRSLLSIDLRGADRIIIEKTSGKTSDMMNLSSTQNLNSI